MQPSSPVSVLILDLDNTVWDWFEMWHAGFSALLKGLVEESRVDQTILEREIRAIHQQHGTSEYAPELLIPALASLQDGSSRQTLLERYDDAIHAFHKARKESLRLYPGVLDTLLTLRDSGVLLVAYTESQAFVTTQRLLRTGLDGVLDFVYSPPDHELPEDVSREDLRRYNPEAYTLKLTQHSHTPSGAKKPNKAVLKAILADFNASPDSTLYVGDNRMKDIVMAQDVGVRDAWAKYGEVQEHSGYPLLRRVSHWPDDDVEEEKRVDQEDSVRASHVLTTGFHEVRQQFRFSRWRHLTRDELDRGLAAWKQAIEVQQHFNDLELRIRAFALTLLVALIGAAGVVLQRGSRTFASALLFGAVVAWGAFYLMDRLWYHPLLLGAVRHAERLEEQIGPQTPGVGLTASIRDASHVHVLGKERTSSWKMSMYYLLIAGVLVLALLSILFTPVGGSGDEPDGPTPTPTSTADGGAGG